MGRIILKDAVKREPGYLYYVSKEGDVCRSKMIHGRKKKEDKDEEE